MRQHFITLATVIFLITMVLPAAGLSREDGFDGSYVHHEGKSYPGDVDWTPFFRDRDSNGVDDMIDEDPGKLVDIFVKLETIPTEDDVVLLKNFVQNVFYKAKYTNTIILRNVDKDLIYNKLRYLERITFIEFIPDVYPFLEVSAEAIKAKPNDLYHDVWEELGIIGRGVNIAVLDGGSNDHETAADMGHVALDDIDDDILTYDPKFIAGWDFEILAGGEFIDPHGDPAIGHGTHVSGTALGTGGAGNDSANRGVAPGAQLVDVKTISDAGFGGFLIPAMEWCIDNRDRDWLTTDTDGIQIMSMSLGTAGESDGSDSMSQTANECVDAGIVVVVACGNNGNSGYITPPAAADKVITIGATNDQNTVTRADDSVAGYSNKGPRNDDGDSDQYDELKPDVVAPGTNIMAPRADSGIAFVGMSGTSMATPHVSGVAALMLEANPDLTPAQVKEILHDSAEARGNVYNPDLSDKYSTNFGYGIVDAYHAVKKAKGSCDIEIEDVSAENAESGKERYDEGDDLILNIHLTEIEGSDVDSYTLMIEDADSGIVLDTFQDSMSGGGQNTHTTIIDLEDWGNNKFLISVVDVDPEDSDTSNNFVEHEIYVNYIPRAHLNLNVTEAYTYQEIRFHGNDSSDEDGEVIEWRFVFGDGEETQWMDTDEVTHEYSDNGEYVAIINAKDDQGAESGPYSHQRQITIMNRIPSANGGGDISGEVDQEIRFQGSGKDKDGNVALYEWDFDGDGSYDWSDEDTGEATYTFEEEGTYEAVLRVTDDDEDTDTDSINVEIVDVWENLPPIAKITSPADDEVHFTDRSIRFDASGSYDPDGKIVAYDWISNVSGVLMEKGAEAQFELLVEDAGDHVITLTVEDDFGVNSEDSVSILIDTPPEAIIDSPIDGESYTDREIQFDASSSFDEDSDRLTYKWTSDLDGKLYEGAEPAFSAQVTTGTHSITLEVSDPYITRSRTIEIEIEEKQEENQIPEAVIDEPSGDIVYPAKKAVRFSALGSSDPDGEILVYMWISDVDGDIYSGGNPEFERQLSPGIHTITLKVKDDTGAWSEPVSGSIRINREPIARIVTISPSPATDWDTIHFLAEGEDEGSIKGYSWSSSVSGELYNGSDEEFYISSLAVGGHIISLRVKDNYGAWSEEVMTTLIVEEYVPPQEENIVPSVTIRNPPDQAEVGGPLLISGIAWDDDGKVEIVELSVDGGAWQLAEGEDYWSFLLDTNIFDDGMHLITARCYDGEDYSQEDFIMVRVANDAPEGSNGGNDLEIAGINGVLFFSVLGVGVFMVVLAGVIMRKRKEDLMLWGIDDSGRFDDDWEGG